MKLEKGRFLIIFLSLILSSCINNLTYKYQVLLLGSENSDVEKENTAMMEEMLLSWNIPYQKLIKVSLSKEIFLKKRTLHYTTAIITRYFKSFSDEEIEILKKISKNYGLSIISFFPFVDDKGKELFGIEEISKERLKSVSFDMIKKDEFLCGDFSLGEVFRGGEFLKIRGKREGVILKSRGLPVFFYHKYGKGVNYYFNFDPKNFLYFDGKHVFLRRAIFQNSGNGFVYFDLEGVCVLRCDDPLRNISWEDDQSYQRFYYKRMGIREWRELIKILKKHEAGMSFAVVTGFKEDGEKERGELYIRGKKVEERVCGQIFDSRDVKYIFKLKERKGISLDYEEEFEGLKSALDSYNNIDIQQHGYIHLNPENSWCNALDKHNDSGWGVEFFNYKENKDISENYQKFAIEEGYKRIVDWFGLEPVVFVPPGLLVSSNTHKILKEFGYKYYFDKFTLRRFVNGDYRNLRFVYVVPVKKLEWWVNPSYFRIFRALPTILGLHDVDFTYFGFNWFDSFLWSWKREGVKRFISLGEFVGILSTKVYAEYDGKKVNLVVDVSEPVGPKNLKNSRFFREKEMVLDLKIPERWKKKFKKGVIQISIPPFKDNLSFKKVIELKR